MGKVKTLIKGVKDKGSSDETFLSLTERNDYQDQVAAISLVNEKGKLISDCLYLYNDGSLSFCSGIPKEQMCNVDENGMMLLQITLSYCSKDLQSEKPARAAKVKATPKTITYETYPFVGVRSCACVKSLRPYKYMLTHSKDSCPGYAYLDCVDGTSGSVITHIASIYYDGSVGPQSSGVPSSPGTDPAKNNVFKIRGDLPKKK